MGRRGLHRSAGLVAALAIVVLAVPASADVAYHRAAGACRVLTDPKGDAQDPTNSGAASALDVLSADLRTGKGTFSVGIEVAHMDEESQPGYAYVFDFVLGGKNFFLQGTLLPGGNDFNAYEASGGPRESRSGTGIGEIEGVVNYRHGAITMTADEGIFAKYGMRPDTTLTGLNVSTWRANGDSTESVTGGTGSHASVGVGLGADDAGTKTTYRLGKRC